MCVMPAYNKKRNKIGNRKEATNLEANERSQMWRFVLVIFRPRLYLSAMTLAALLRQEAQRTVTGCLEFTMRHFQ
jgi:hypothetical protein